MTCSRSRATRRPQQRLRRRHGRPAHDRWNLSRLDSCAAQARQISELLDVLVPIVPGKEAPAGMKVGVSRVLVVDRDGEEFQKAAHGLFAGRGEDRRHDARASGYDCLGREADSAGASSRESLWDSMPVGVTTVIMHVLSTVRTPTDSNVLADAESDSIQRPDLFKRGEQRWPRPGFCRVQARSSRILRKR